MDFWGSITVPKNTPVTNPTRAVVTVQPGRVKKVWLFFPDGHAGTTRVRVLRYEHQVWPTNIGGWYLGNDTVIEFEENFLVLGWPYEFILEGYNTSVSNNHTTYCHFTILPEERVIVPRPPRRATLF